MFFVFIQVGLRSFIHKNRQNGKCIKVAGGKCVCVCRGKGAGERVRVCGGGGGGRGAIRKK